VAELDFWQEIVLVVLPVVIPVIIGAYTASRVTDSWQIKREKFKLRREILEEFDKTFSKYHHICRTFILKLEHEYSHLTSASKIDELTPTISGVKYDFPTEESKQPLERFKETHDEYLSKVFEINSHISKFKSTLRLYFQDYDSLENELEKLRDDATIDYILIENTFISKNLADFSNWKGQFWNRENQFYELIRDFQLKLISSKLRDVKL